MNIPSSLVKLTEIYFLFNTCKGTLEFPFLNCSILFTGGSAVAKMILFAHDGGAVVTKSALAAIPLADLSASYKWTKTGD